MFNGKMKAITFSYDDGITQDQRLIHLFDKYALKGTFNLNSGYFGMANSLVREEVTVAHCKPRAQEIRRIYEGHEIAGHTLTHPNLSELMDDEEIIRQVEQDRLTLSEIAGYEVVGFAYPGGGINFNEHVAELIKSNTGVKYARTTVRSHSFDLPSNLFTCHPTVQHHKEWDNVIQLADEFVNLETETPKCFFIWGHTYEFDIHDTWDRFEELLKRLSGHKDIFYGTNKEVLLGTT